MAPPGLIIFDCDGVLVDSELIDARIRSECLIAAGFQVTPEELANDPGVSGARLLEKLERRFGRLPDDFMQTTRTRIMRTFTDELRAIEGVSELLGSLDFPVCVASNSHIDRLRHSLAVTGLSQFFEPYLFSAIMVPQGKPAPDLFLLAASRLSASPAACLVVEDSIHGVLAARAAGMEVVGFCGASHCPDGHADGLREAGCTEVFARMIQLGDFLKTLTL